MQKRFENQEAVDSYKKSEKYKELFDFQISQKCRYEFRTVLHEIDDAPIDKIADEVFLEHGLSKMIECAVKKLDQKPLTKKKLQ